MADVGYNPEIYVGDEREQGGLRIMRDENGHPIKPVFEINQSAWALELDTAMQRCDLHKYFQLVWPVAGSPSFQIRCL